MVQLFMRNDEFEWIWLIQELHDVGFWPLSFWLRLRRRGDLNRPLINHRQELLDIWIYLRHWYWAEIMENSQLHCWRLLENKYNSTTDIDMLSLSLSTCHRLSQVWIEVILRVSLQKISKACLRCLWWMCGMSQKQTAKSASCLCPPWAPCLLSRSFLPWTTHLDKLFNFTKKHVTHNGTAFKHSLTQIDCFLERPKTRTAQSWDYLKSGDRQSMSD